MIFRILVALTFLTSAALNAGTSKDTVFIKRPYYLGVTVSYTEFSGNAQLGKITPDISPFSYIYFQEFTSGTTAGISFAFPFLRRWECESALQRTSWEARRSKFNPHVDYNVTPPAVVGYNTVTEWEYTPVWSVRSVFGYELMHQGRFTVFAGAGGWLNVQDKEFIPGNTGMEGYIKMYTDLYPGVTLQTGAGYGLTKAGGYYTFRAALLLKGSRTMRVKPDHYYIRTYESGE